MGSPSDGLSAGSTLPGPWQSDHGSGTTWLLCRDEHPRELVHRLVAMATLEIHHQSQSPPGTAERAALLDTVLR